MPASTAIPLGPGWTGILCVPGPAFLPSGFGGQEASGLGRVMPITRAIAVEWAYHALVFHPSMDADPLGGWWPSRSLVVRWYENALDPTSLGKKTCYYKANDEGAFDLAMPIGQNPNDVGTFHDGFDRVPAHRYKKAYVTPPDWGEENICDMCERFMDNAIPEVISKEVAKVPADEKENKRAELQAMKRAWFELERRNYLAYRGSRTNGHFVTQVSPPEFSSVPMTPRACRTYNVDVDQDLNDWEYHGEEDEAETTTNDRRNVDGDPDIE